MKKIAILLAVLLGMASCAKKAPAPVSPDRPLQFAVPEHGAYTGAYIDFGDHEDDVTVEAIENFEKLCGKRQAIVASSSYWGEQTFPAANLHIIFRHGSVPLVYWSPWDRPYDEDKGPDRFSLTSILAGKWDAYIDKWGDGARAFGQPFFVSFGNEMNGTWFPWSGCFYGGDKEIGPQNSEIYEGPETFKKAWRYVVDRVRARGAKNVLWVFHVMNYSFPQETWNLAEKYYPGADYVDWLGMSVYGAQYADDGWGPFPPLLDWPYTELTELDPKKPIMLAEWGVGEFPKKGSRAQWISEGFAAMKKYPRIKAAVFWHERWQNEDDTYSNLRINASPESLKAYRDGVADPFWIDHPIFNGAK